MVASVVVSFDFELGWGVLESDTWKVREKSGVYTGVRPIIANLFRLLKELEVPTTWATVSSMTIDSETELSVEHLPAGYQDAVVKFFRSSNWESRCALDLFDHWGLISNFSELATHTSSHLYAGHPEVNADHFVADVNESVRQLESHFSVPIRSIVFPRDQSKYSFGVGSAGKLDYRIGPAAHSRGRSQARRIIDGGVSLFREAAPSVYGLNDNGQFFQSGSLYYNWKGGDFELIKQVLVRLQARKVLRLEHQADSVVHVWIHPFNLAESSVLCKSFFCFLRGLADLRSSGGINIISMNQLANEFRS